MVLPVYGYGTAVLKEKAKAISPDYPELSEFVQNMWDTMYASDGVGLAAPQVGKSIRLFVIDGSAMADNAKDPSLNDFKKVFINAEILEESGDSWLYNEGCLSVPGIREDIRRKPRIRIRWVDENFKEYDEVLTGMRARIVQHEYDHTEGILLTDHLSQIRRRLLKKRFNDILEGFVDVDYKMVFAKR